MPTDRRDAPTQVLHLQCGGAHVLHRFNERLLPQDSIKGHLGQIRCLLNLSLDRRCLQVPRGSDGSLDQRHHNLLPLQSFLVISWEPTKRHGQLLRLSGVSASWEGSAISWLRHLESHMILYLTFESPEVPTIGYNTLLDWMLGTNS